MKVLIVGHFRDGTGYSQAAIDYALALDAAGADVAIRAIKLNDAEVTLPERLLQLEAKPISGSDVVIQHTLPYYYDRNGDMLNVGMYASETSRFTSAWADRINTMDSAIVFNHQSQQASLRSGVKVPIHIVPHACDTDRFQQSHKYLDLLAPYKERGEFVFYTIGEMVRRKNLASLLKAFHLEFDPSEPVNLCIKTSKPGLSPADCHASVESFCHKIKAGLKLHGGRTDFYRKEIVIAERLTPTGMLRLHSAADVFVQPSYGEAWSLGAFDAMAMGKTPIVSACTGYLDYMSSGEGWLVQTHDEPVFGVEDSMSALYVGDESWSQVDIYHLRRCMREAYENQAMRKQKSKAGILRAYDFSYGAVGKLLKEVLRGQIQAQNTQNSSVV